MEKKVFLALALLILFVLGASFALGASIYTKMGTKPSQLYNLTNSTTYWILGFRVWSNIDDSLTQIIINTTTEGSSFNPANDLEALTTPGSNAGVQIYRDTNTNGVYDADTDAGVTSGASWSSWGASGNGYKSTMSGITAGTYNVSKGEPTTDNFFVIVKTRVIDGQKLYPTDAVKFNTTISEVRTNSNTTGITPPPHTNVTSNTLTIDGSNPTISQFITRDNNSNGYIEGIEVTFSEPINDNTLNSTMANYCFRVRGADDGLMIWTTGTARNDTIIEINFTQIQFTNMTPTVNYTMNDTCGITDVAGNFLQSIANTVSIDGAPPVFMGVGSANSCYSYDNDKDGNLNNMNCSMSENISLNTITTNQFKAFVNSGGAATNNMQLTISSVSNVSRGPDQNNITITFNDAIAGTGNASLNYSGNSLFDSKGNRTPSNFTIGVVDSAGPVWTDVVTRDNNSNGNVEGFKITFTEDVADNSLGTNISFCFRVLNSDDASVTSNTGDGVNDNVLFLNFTQQTWTNTTPTINYTANNSCSFSDASPPGSSILSALQPNKQSVDGAPPVFLTAASWDTDNDGKLNIINFTMSENVTTSSSLKFVNVWAMNVNYGSPTENRQIAGAGIVGSSGPGNNITWNVNDVVYGTGNVSLNYVAAADAINDTQRNHTLGNSSVTITDNAAPIFLYKGTLDNDNNGWIDAFQLNFSEGIGNYTYGTTKNAFNATHNFSIGFLGSNLSSGVGAGATCGVADALCIPQADIVIDPDNSFGGVNDSVIFLNLTRGKSYNFSSGYSANVTFSPNGTSLVEDMVGNDLLANVSAENATDGAAPVFWSAIAMDINKDGSVDFINLSLSEQVSGPTISTDAFEANVSYGKDGSGNSITRQLSINGAPLMTNTSDQRANITIKLDDAVIGTGTITLLYNYSATNGAYWITDKAGLKAAGNSSIVVTDNASAVVLTEYTVDGNTNGYLDAIKVNFSESVLDSSFADAADNITVGSIARASITFSTGDVINDNVVFLNFSGTTYNTGATPNVNFSINSNNGTSNMTDLSFLNISSNTTDELSTDKAVPVFLSAYTTDEDKNGALDTINLSMSETLVAGVNIKGTWAATVNYGPATRTLTISSVNPIAAGNVTLKLNNAVFGTGAMTLSYTTAAGGVNDSVGNAVPTNASVTVSDNASAVIFSEQTVDGNTNGYLDAIKVNFSEPILDSSFTDTGDNITVGSISRGSITFNTGDTVNDDVVFLNFSGTTYNTGNTPIVNFSLTGTDGTSNMTDLSFVNISSNTTAEASTDKASPVLMTKETLSFNRTGYLDTINITFSESIVDNTSANFTIEGITAAGAIAFVDTAFPGDSGNNNNIFLGFTGTTYFTNGTPTVNYSYGGAATSRDYILDAAGNKAVRNDTANGAAAADKAPPVFLVAAASDGATAANGVDSDDYILFNFSEPIRLQGGLAISNTTVNSSKESGAILYTNATGAAWVGGLDIQVGRFNNTQNTTLNVTFPTAYSNLSAPDVYKFFMNYTISDASGNNPVGQDNKTNVTLTGSFQDVQAPSVSSVWTNDTNANGKIDSIVVTMSENVWNASRRCGLGWNVTGYSVNTALSNCPNNTRVNLTVTELSVFDTNATPAVSYTATVGSIVDLNNNNNLTDYNTTAATDKSPPVLLNATTYDDDADGYIDAYNLTFSENVTDDKFNRTGAATALTLAGSALWTITNATGTLKNDHFVNLQFTDYKNASNFTPDITGSFFNDTANNAMESLASGGLTEYDAAAPQFWLVSGFQGNFTNRSGKDGYVLGTKFRANQNISIKFNVSENVTQPTVTVGGNAATLAGTTNTTEGVQFEYYYTMTTAVSEGSVTLSISASDTKGNPSVSNSRTNTTQNLSTDYRVSRVDRLVLTDQPQDDGLQLKLNWTAVTDADFSRYAFICNMTNSTQLSSLSPVTYSSTSTHTTALITTYHDGTNRTIADGTEYFCLINVTDDVGNVNASMNVSAIPYANANVTIAINKWNLVGTPRSLNNTKLSAHGFASGDLYKYYNSTDATWYDLAQSTDRMNHLKGYWIYNYDGNQANLTYKENTGTSATLVTTTIYTGWNLISSPSNTAGDNVTNVLNDRIGSTKWSIIWYYNASDTSGNGWYYNNPSGTGTLGAFDRDGGYWISITSAGNNTLLTGEV